MYDSFIGYLCMRLNVGMVIHGSTVYDISLNPKQYWKLRINTYVFIKHKGRCKRVKRNLTLTKF